MATKNNIEMHSTLNVGKSVIADQKVLISIN